LPPATATSASSLSAAKSRPACGSFGSNSITSSSLRPGGELRLGFDGASPVLPAAAATAATAAPASEKALRDETLRYRLGLTQRQAGGRTTGFVVRPNVSMPALERAGLRPGDVIVGVNGSGFDEERMLELAWQIANSSRTEFEVERGGRRIRLAIEQ
jgi:S1-C subfamily serine protease